MTWQQRIRDWGVPLPQSPDFAAILLAVVLVAGACWIGWFVGGRLGPRIGALARRWTGQSDDYGDKLACSIARFGIIALLLLVVGNAATLSMLGRMIVGVALGIAAGMLAYRIGRGARLGGVPAGILGAIVLVAATAASLGGMKPLMDGLDGVGVRVGTHHMTLLGLVNFIVVAVVLYALARLANRVLLHTIGHARALDVSQRALMQKLASIGVVVVAVLFGIDLLGIDLTALTVFSGAFGLAMGFGLQKTFGNLIAGLILLMDRSVKPGDVIVVGDTFGQVTKIGVRAVSIVTRDGKEHLLPNEQLMTEPVENWSYTSRNVRVHIKVGVAYDSDLALAQRLMIEAASASPRVLDKPKPAVWLKEFAESSIDHEILCWIADPEAGVGNVRSAVLNRLWQLFKENGIEIPFPRRDVHIRTQPEPPEAD
jgi:small-conductance mechanosensitive channel